AACVARQHHRRSGQLKAQLQRAHAQQRRVHRAPEAQARAPLLKEQIKTWRVDARRGGELHARMIQRVVPKRKVMEALTELALIAELRGDRRAPRFQAAAWALRGIEDDLHQRLEDGSLAEV